MDFDSHNVIPSASTQVVILTMAQAPMMPTIVPIFISPREKLEKFNGLNFKMWQQNMLFYLTTLNLVSFLTKDDPKLKEDENNIQVIKAIDSLKHSNFLCKNFVLNGLTDSLYNVYYTKSSANELWESLDQKYKPEDAGAKNFFHGSFP